MNPSRSMPFLVSPSFRSCLVTVQTPTSGLPTPPSDASTAAIRLLRHANSESQSSADRAYHEMQKIASTVEEIVQHFGCHCFIEQVLQEKEVEPHRVSLVMYVLLHLTTKQTY